MEFCVYRGCNPSPSSVMMFLYPALYTSASQLSAASQSNYLWLIRGEYFFLLVAAIFSLNLGSSPTYFVANAFVFLASLTVLVTRNWKKPEQDWYKGRALAESIKTSCWRYCMRAEPFSGDDTASVTRGEFRNHLRAILAANRHIGEKIPPDAAADDQITASMDATRDLTLDQRKAFYEKHRIREQRSWYARKAGDNRKASQWWMTGGIAAYALAILFVLLRIAYPKQEIWPIEPLIVVASSIIGWTQVKKFNELASSYTLTAHEIGIIQNRVQDIKTEVDFSDFVNEAEQAFSREHTQWVARQQSQ